MHFTIFWLINCGEEWVWAAGEGLQDNWSKVHEHVSGCETPVPRLTPQSQGTLNETATWMRGEIPWGALACKCKLGGFSPFLLPQAVPWTAGAGPADRLPPCPCPPCSGSCRRAGAGCTQPALQDTQGTIPVSAELRATQHCHTHRNDMGKC